MRQDFASTAGADPAQYIAIGKGIMLGYHMYRGELVPRPWAILGIAAGTIALASAALQLFAVYENQSAISASLIIPEVVWELFLGIYLTFKGFAASPLLSSTADPPSPRIV